MTAAPLDPWRESGLVEATANTPIWDALMAELTQDGAA